MGKEKQGRVDIVRGGRRDKDKKTMRAKEDVRGKDIHI